MEPSARLAELQAWEAHARSFSGWDHSALAIRALDGGPPWDYIDVARRAASRARRVVDLSTGGGERFARIAAGSNGRFVATEEWPVNARVASDTLGPLGVPVVLCEVHVPRIPFAASTFNLVLSRHSAVDTGEVDRILTPGGRFITQQVTPDTWPELRRFFPRMTVFEDHFKSYAEAFRGLGYRVSLRRHDSPTAYGSLGDLVFLLVTAPWEIPEFNVAGDLDALLALEAACRRDEGVVVTEGRYLLEATKPT